MFLFYLKEASPSSYYAIFDGHAGHYAAAYSAAHLHQFLAESEYFDSNPERALHDAFLKTDALFIEKCQFGVSPYFLKILNLLILYSYRDTVVVLRPFVLCYVQKRKCYI